MLSEDGVPHLQHEGRWPKVQPRALAGLLGVLLGAFAGLSWADARQIAAPVSFDTCTRDDPEAFVRNRACNALAGVDNMPWEPGVGGPTAQHLHTLCARALRRVVRSVWFDWLHGSSDVKGSRKATPA